MRKFKKLMAVLLCFVMLVSVLPFAVSAAEADQSTGAKSGTTGDCTWTLDDNGVLTISGNGAMGDYGVNPTLPWGTGIVNVVIKNGVTSIGSYAFYNCSDLTVVTIPDSITSIGYEAFSKCTGLTSVTIPNSVTSIGSYAFFYCTSLTSITIPKGVTSIGGSAFFGCSGLTSVTLPDGLISISRRAFEYCESLTSIDIPNSVESIEIEAFANCSLSNISFPNSVKKIGNYAFRNCNLKNVTVPDSVSFLGSGAFYGCTELASINILSDIIKIDGEDYSGGYGYEPDAFIKTGWYEAQPDGAVYLNNTLCGYKGKCPEKITIKSNVTTIAGSAFYTWDLNNDYSALMEVELPEGLCIIGARAFLGCPNMKSITIPKSVNEIDSFGIGYRFAQAADPKTIEGFVIYGYKGTAAEAYAKETDITFVPINDEPQEYTDEATGITVIADSGLSLSVTKKDNSTAGQYALGGNEKVDSVFDIKLLKDGEEAQPTGKAIIKIPCDNKNAKVYRVEQNGTLTNMNAVYENGYLVVETEHLSTYIVSVPKTIEIGDVTLDGFVDITDVTALQRHLAEYELLTDEQMLYSDTNNDGVVTVADATLLQMYLAEFDVTLG